MSMALTSNRMCSSEILDKYHSCCIGNDKFHLASSREIHPHFQYNTGLWYLSQVSLLPMLLLVQTTW